MFYLFRIIYTLITALLKSRVPVNREISRAFRVWIHEADFQYINESQFTLFAEMARWDLVIRMGFLRPLIKYRCLGAIGGHIIRIEKPLKRFDVLTIKTRIVGSSDKFLFLEHLFVKHDQIIAMEMVKLAFRGAKGVVSIKKIFEDMKISMKLGEVPEEITAWLNAENQMCEKMRNWTA